MIKNYFKIIVRNLWRNKIISVINIIGLALGIAACIILLLYIKNELSYDKFHKNKERIFRIVDHSITPNTEDHFASIYLPIVKDLAKELPEIENWVRIFNSKKTISNRNFHFIENVLYIDTSFFSIFSFKILKGNPKNLLQKKSSIVLSESTAKKYFGDINPIGKLVRMNFNRYYTISGIIEDAPKNSHVKYNALISLENIIQDSTIYKSWSGGISCFSYILINEKADEKLLEKKFEPIVWEKINKEDAEDGFSMNLYLEPLTKMHLYSDAKSDLDSNGSISNVIIFSLIAFFILIIACINFINFSIAGAIKRSKEIGLRKTSGAGKNKILYQFLGESFFYVFISIIISLVFVELFEPFYYNIIGQKLNFHLVSFWQLIIICSGFLLLIGILAGIYPSFYYSRFKVTKVFKEISTFNNKKISMTRILVIGQFIISFILVFCSIVIFKQNKYVSDKELGYDINNMIVVNNVDEIANKADIIKKEINLLAGVESVSFSTGIPGVEITSNGYLPEGSERFIMCSALDIDVDFIKNFKIKLLKGRTFSKVYKTDESAYIINETLAKYMGWKNPIGKFIERNGKHEIIGVVQDFHFNSMHQKIQPLIITQVPHEGFGEYDNLYIRLKSDAGSETIYSIQQIWNKFEAERPFRYKYLNNLLLENYVKEKKLASIFNYFTILALVIAILGLFGFSYFVIKQKTKELSMRKVLGAKIIQLFKSLSFDFLKLILIAYILAIPLAWYFMNNWLNNYAYKIKISIDVLIITLLIGYVVSQLTIIFQIIKVVNVNPVENLNDE